MSQKVEEARNPRHILLAIRALLWAWWNGYQVVPGYTIRERNKETGRLYVAIEMEKPG